MPTSRMSSAAQFYLQQNPQRLGYGRGFPRAKSNVAMNHRVGGPNLTRISVHPPSGVSALGRMCVSSTGREWASIPGCADDERIFALRWVE